MIQKLIRNKTLFAIVSIAMGVYICFAGRGVLYNIVRVAGYVMLATAVGYALIYFFGPRRDQVQLGYAGLATAAGLMIVWMAPAIVNLFPMLAGLGLIVVGLTNLMHAAREEGMPAASKVGPVLTIVLGALILFHPGAIVNAVVMLAGIALILNGLSELDMIRRIW